jgi:RNA polymerase sigma-70 factor (ECF subfamily)
MNDLVQLAKSGDPAALEKLLSQIAPSIQRFGARMCRNGHDADDVLQDTLMTILSHLHEFEGRSSFTSWVFTLTRTACNRRRRGLKNQPAEPIENMSDLNAGGPTPEQGADSREMSQLLEKALEDLPEEYREVLLLRDVEALTAPEAAEALSISVEALKSRLHRARQALRAALRPVLEPTPVATSSTCPDMMERWSRRLEGDLDAIDCTEMEKHLATCPSCTAACSALKTALVACRSEATRDVRPEVQEQVRSALRTWMSRSAFPGKV